MRLRKWILGMMLLMLAGHFFAMAGTVQWNFTTDHLKDGTLPLVPTETTLGGTVDDWSLEANPANPINSEFAADFSEGSLHFSDLETISGNLSLKTSMHSDVRKLYPLSGEGDRLWIVCDYQMLQYGRRADGEHSALDHNMAQVFWASFRTSGGSDIGLQCVAGNLFSLNSIYFTSIGSATESQDDYMKEGRLIENLVGQPNLERRTLYIRITENTNTTVTVDAKYDQNAYQTIDPVYYGPLSPNAAGGEEGDENTLLCIGNNSENGAIEFKMYQLMLTDQDPDGTNVGEWSVY